MTKTLITKAPYQWKKELIRLLNDGWEIIEVNFCTIKLAKYI